MNSKQYRELEDKVKELESDLDYKQQELRATWQMFEDEYDNHDKTKVICRQLIDTIDEINSIAIHAGCHANPKCIWCQIQRLAKYEGKK